jgi:hypothetical protein
MARVSTPEPLVLRPRKARRVCWVLAPLVVVIFTVLSTALSGSTTGSDSATFQPGDRGAMIVLGFFVAAGILLFTRPKVTADLRHIVIRNVIGGYDLPWSLVTAVRFDRGSAWANLELVDGDVIGVNALQATDKEHAVAGVRALRAMLAEAHAAAAAAAPAE